jgi:hypothetical protein
MRVRIYGCKMKLSSLTLGARVYSYDEITRIATAQIELYMKGSRRQTSLLESRERAERAYGVYIGWRALVESYPDKEKFGKDDLRLETLIRSQ